METGPARSERGDKVRILYLTNRLAPAGAETFLLNRLSVLDRSRFEPYVGELRAGGDLKPSFEHAGVPTITFGAGRQLDTGVFYRLYSFLRRERITILEAHVWWACLVGRIVGTAARVPIIITNEQDMRAGETTHRADVLFAGDLTMRLSDACVHITKATQRSFAETTPKILQGPAIRRIIPNGIDARKIAETVARVDRKAKRASLGIAEDAVVIGNVARLAEQKGLTYLLPAFANILEREPRAHLVLVGWGPQEEELRALAKELRVDHRVTFAGKRLDVGEILATLDVFAFSSVHEGQGIAILEAMAAGVPVVTTNVDGIPDMVRHEASGLLVPPRDPEAIVAAVMRVLTDEALVEKITDGAKRVAFDEVSVEAAGRAYNALYEELLARKGLGA